MQISLVDVLPSALILVLCSIGAIITYVVTKNFTAKAKAELIDILEKQTEQQKNKIEELEKEVQRLRATIDTLVTLNEAQARLTRNRGGPPKNSASMS